MPLGHEMSQVQLKLAAAYKLNWASQNVPINFPADYPPLHPRLEGSNAPVMRAVLTAPGGWSTLTMNHVRFEAIGDAVIEVVVCDAIHEHLPHATPDVMTQVRNAVCSGPTLARLGLLYDLYDRIRKPPLRDSRDNNYLRHKALVEDAFEALVGAVFFVHGFDRTKRWLRILLDPWLDLAYSSLPTNSCTNPTRRAVHVACPDLHRAISVAFGPQPLPAPSSRHWHPSNLPRKHAWTADHTTYHADLPQDYPPQLPRFQSPAHTDCLLRALTSTMWIPSPDSDDAKRGNNAAYVWLSSSVIKLTTAIMNEAALPLVYDHVSDIQCVVQLESDMITCVTVSLTCVSGPHVLGYRRPRACVAPIDIRTASKLRQRRCLGRKRRSSVQGAHLGSLSHPGCAL